MNPDIAAAIADMSSAELFALAREAKAREDAIMRRICPPQLIRIIPDEFPKSWRCIEINGLSLAYDQDVREDRENYAYWSDTFRGILFNEVRSGRITEAESRCAKVVATLFAQHKNTLPDLGQEVIGYF